MALLAARALSLGYGSDIIIKKLDFTVNKGDYLCIVGENGSGKSTLMKTILGLIPPAGGEIVRGDGLKKNEIGYLPQQTVVQRDFPASVFEIVLSGCQGRLGLRPFYSRKEKELALANMEKLGIAGLKDHCYRDLSGGQQQRVLLARALCATRKVMLLDEPVSGLDPLVTAEMYTLISELNKEGITIIMISHDIGAAVRYASHVLHIGSHIFFGTKEEYLRSETGRYFVAEQNEAAEAVRADIEAATAAAESETVVSDKAAAESETVVPDNAAAESETVVPDKAAAVEETAAKENTAAGNESAAAGTACRNSAQKGGEHA